MLTPVCNVQQFQSQIKNQIVFQPNKDQKFILTHQQMWIWNRIEIFSTCPGTPVFWTKCKAQSCHIFSIFMRGLGRSGRLGLRWWMLFWLFSSRSWLTGTSGMVCTPVTRGPPVRASKAAGFGPSSTQDTGVTRRGLVSASESSFPPV